MSWTQRAYGWSTSLLLLTACATLPPAAATPPAARPKTAQLMLSAVASGAATEFAAAQAVEVPAAAPPGLAARTAPTELTCTLDQFTVVVDPWVKTYNEKATECQMDIVDGAQPVFSLIVDPSVRSWANVHPTFPRQRVTSQAVVDISPPWDDFSFIFNSD